MIFKHSPKTHRLARYAHRCAKENLGYVGQIEWCTYCTNQCPAMLAARKKLWARMELLRKYPPKLDDHCNVI